MTSSILTNPSAMTALRTLQETNKALEVTQKRISTGYRVGEAADNAAYWSIATTMRSDNKALSTVQDALGLGAAMVDTAYTAMDSTRQLLDEMKSNLVAAKQPGVDKAKIQSTVAQLQKQLEGIASSATFSGSNWLYIDTTAGNNFDPIQKIVSSFSRDTNGSISVGTIEVDTTTVALYDVNATSDGILETETAAKLTTDFSWTPGTFANNDTITVSVAVDGGAAQNIAITVTNAASFSIDDLVSTLNGTNTANATVVTGLSGATASTVDGKLILTSATAGSTSSVEITGVGFTQADATTLASIGFTTVDAVTGVSGVNDVDITTASDDQISAYIDAVDLMLSKVITAASDLGAIKSRVDLQKDFASKLMDAIERGVGQLVDADMTQESTRLQALQVQQQLGIQALSIANASAQNILALFKS